MLRRLSVVLLAGLALFMGLAASPATAAPPISNTVIHEKNLVETFVDTVECVGVPAPLYTITLTTNLVVKETIFANGNVHATFTQTGSFVAVPLDPTLPSYTGHVTVWGGFNQNAKTVGGTFTFNATGRGSDGSRVSVHEVDHFNVRPDGTINEFSRCR
jgi:hypothetical protein